MDYFRTGTLWDIITERELVMDMRTRRNYLMATDPWTVEMMPRELESCQDAEVKAAVPVKHSESLRVNAPEVSSSSGVTVEETAGPSGLPRPREQRKPTAMQRASQGFKQQQKRKAVELQLIEQARDAKRAKLDMNILQRKENFKVYSRKTQKGQPLMADRMNLLLRKIEKSQKEDQQL